MSERRGPVRGLRLAAWSAARTAGAAIRRRHDPARQMLLAIAAAVLLGLLLGLPLAALTGPIASAAEVPAEFAADKEHFARAWSYFLDANEVGHELLQRQQIEPESLGVRELEQRYLLLLEHGVAQGEAVSDAWLDFLHPELKWNYRTRLVEGHKMLMMGLIEDDERMQGVANELIARFYREFWPQHGAEISAKLQ